MSFLEQFAIFALAILFMVSLSPSVGRSMDPKEKSIGEMLSGLIYDQEMRICCQTIIQDAEFPSLNCTSIKDGVLLVANGGYANPNYYTYFWKCIARSKDSTGCCLDNGVSFECLPVCNSKKHPSFEEMNIILAKACFRQMSDTLSTCIAKQRGKIKNAEIILHMENTL